MYSTLFAERERKFFAMKSNNWCYWKSLILLIFYFSRNNRKYSKWFLFFSISLSCFSFILNSVYSVMFFPLQLLLSIYLITNTEQWKKACAISLLILFLIVYWFMCWSWAMLFHFLRPASFFFFLLLLSIKILILKIEKNLQTSFNIFNFSFLSSYFCILLILDEYFKIRE